jgi:Sulfotransferase family
MQNSSGNLAMTASPLRGLRKVIYRLDEQGGTLGKALVQGSLACYRCYDSLFLKRASRPDYTSEKVLLRDRGVMFVGVPKVATRSILAALNTAAGGDKQGQLIVELDIQTVMRRYPEASTYFKFTFVRNPWSRAVSCYLDKIRNDDPIKQARHLHRRRGLKAGMSFEAFAEWLNSQEGSDDVADRHWMSQHRILSYDQPDVISYDFVGRFERLAQDYQRLQKLSGLVLPRLSHRLKTQAPNEYRIMYNDRSIESIAQRYAEDIKMFGYDFDNASSG